MKLAATHTLSFYVDARIPDNNVDEINRFIDDQISLHLNGLTCIIQDAYDKKSIEYLKKINDDRELSVDIINSVFEVRELLK